MATHPGVHRDCIRTQSLYILIIEKPFMSYSSSKEVARANRTFYDAFEALDLEAMIHVWSQRVNVRCIHPGRPALEGREAVLTSWAAIFHGTDRMSVEVTDPQIQVFEEVGWVTAIERIVSVVGGATHEARVAVTNLFVREDEGWFMVLHHGSPIVSDL